MEIVFIGKNRREIIEGQLRVSEILEKFDINPKKVLVAKDRDILSPKDIVKEDDTIEILPIVSGG